MNNKELSVHCTTDLQWFWKGFR